MRTIVLPACTAAALLACTAEQGPTEPGGTETMAALAPPSAAVVNLWRLRGPHQFGTLLGVAVGVTTNAAGQSVVYGIGGCDVVGGSGSQCTVSHISIYNVATNAWSGDNEFQASVWLSNGVGTLGGKLYVTGGYGTHDKTDGMSRRAWAYDPASGQVTPLPDMPRATAEGVTGVIGNKLYVLPGSCDANRWPLAGYCEQEPIRRLYRFDPAQNKWGARKSAPHYHRAGAGGVINGKFYVVGGFQGRTPVAALDVYDPGSDSWTTKAPLPVGGAVIGTALQGKLYVLAGTKAYRYDPGTNKWSAIASPASAQQGVVRVVVNGKPKLLAIGGFLSSTTFEPANIEVYTP